MKQTLGAFHTLLAAGLVSCSSGTDAPMPGGTGGTTSLDGVWDITVAGTADIKSGEMTVNGTSVTGTIIYGDEGEDYGGCIVTKSRTEFSFVASGESVSGSSTRYYSRSAGPNGCGPTERKQPSTFAGNRSKAAPATDTNLNGEWLVNGFAAVVDGLTAKAWEEGVVSTTAAPSLTASIAGDLFTVSSPSSSKNRYNVAAKKR